MGYLSLVDKISDGTQTIFNVPFPYLKPEYVKVYQIGPDNPGEPLELPRSFQSPNTIELTDPVPTGFTVRVSRVTYDINNLVDFTGDSYALKKHLNLSQEQLLHLIQELDDVKVSRLEMLAALKEKADRLHAAQHAADGEDPVTPDAIGALDYSHLDEAGDPHPQYLHKDEFDVSEFLELARQAEEDLKELTDLKDKIEDMLEEAQRLADKVVEIAGFDPDAYVRSDELQDILDELAVSEHTHEISDVDGLEDRLNSIESKISESPDGVVSVILTGDGVTEVWEVDHQLGTTDVNVHVYNVGSGMDAHPGIQRVDPNTVKVYAKPAIPVGKKYKVTVTAPAITSSPFMRYDSASRGWVFNALVPANVVAGCLRAVDSGVEFTQ